MEGTRGSITLAVFVAAVLILPSGCILAHAAPDELKFTYYLHDNFVPPDTTAVQVASANGTFTNAGIFGDITVFDSVIREGVEKDSPVIGAAGGEIVFLKALNFITFVHELHIPNYNGTLTASAMFNASAPWEIGISTGTGSFRGVTGYLNASVAVPDPQGSILKYDATLFLP